MSGHATIAPGVWPLYACRGGAPSNESFTLRTHRTHQKPEDSSYLPKASGPPVIQPTSPPHRRALALAGLVVALAAIFVALALPATAMASKCGDKVLADWFDNGRIDRLYDLHCYEEAIDSIPSDLRDYANAEEIISRALQAAVNGDLDPGGPDPSPENGTPGGGPPNDPNTPSDPNTPTTPNGEVAPDVDTSGISSVPIPLIVLALMSVALLTAGGLGYLRRRHVEAETGEPQDPEDLL
jgi:hypothetical protein